MVVQKGMITLNLFLGMHFMCNVLLIAIMLKLVLNKIEWRFTSTTSLGQLCYALHLKQSDTSIH